MSRAGGHEGAMPFSALGLSSHLVRALEACGYVAPTAVQAATIPAVLAGRDVWAMAETGSGKTGAFALPLLHLLDASQRELPRAVRALILVPTRELAAQIGQSFTRYGRYLPEHAKVITAFGGVSINPQLMGLRGGADVVVATPGRLLDLIEHNGLRLSDVSTVVLDEADRLFDLGFADELGRILALLPERRQTLLFSATFPPAVHALAEQQLRDPFRFDGAGAESAGLAILERAIEVDAPQRTQLLLRLIEANAWRQVLVFVATKYATEHVAEKLRRSGVAAGALHGELSQGARTTALADFKAGTLQVLVATDLASRGLDIVHLPVVVNYDLPRSAVDYTHRIGRTGRAGEQGVAVSFISAETHAHFQLIEKRQAREIPREQIEGFEPVDTDLPVPASTGGVKGKRKSKKDKLREAAAAAANPPPPAPAAPSSAPIRWNRLAEGRRFR